MSSWSRLSCGDATSGRSSLECVDVSGDSALHSACREGWTRVVRILLMAANDLGEERNWINTPIDTGRFFNLRNGKGRRAIDVATLPSLMEELHSDGTAPGLQCGSIDELHNPALGDAPVSTMAASTALRYGMTLLDDS
ncbi:Ankyrin repeat-containing domain [Phytophthora cactorum]|nr:Ankyrin repeat-containing domain [Phytophthora cactorum]